MREQILLEICEVLRHGNTLFLSLHEGSEAIGDLDVDAEDLVHLLLELGRMGRLAEDTNLAFLKTFDERLITTGTMRIEDILRIGIALAHGLTDLVVAVGGATDERGDAFVALAIEVVDAGEVRGIAYVHRIGERLL